ncbi:YihA family ribosome biogenesis GTP-binding protein [Patescibacteria group bacterium]|nr:YihA family ribosome biogenesis GTP-binding protein [Patescibacteria group bacterium]
MPTKILSSKFVISSPSYDLCPPAEMPEYAFIGRSNVGKSSLINAICGKKEFAKTSPKPGKTQLINYFEIESKDDENNIQNWHLVDLPGYGYAKVSKEASNARQGMISEYILRRKNLKRVFVLIDSKIPPQHSDLAFISRLNSSHISFSLVFTKSDKVSQKELSANVKAFMNELGTMMRQIPEYFITSTEKA